jgi:ankyrin repeat protein
MSSERRDIEARSNAPLLDSQLHHAVALNDTASAEKLLIAGARVNAVGGGGSTPLRIALINRHSEMAVLLRKHGGAVLGIRTVFDDATEGRLEELRNAVAQDRSLLAATDDDGWTLLHWAALGGSTPIVAWLLEQGANVRALTRHEQTPLHMASTADNPEAAELLIQHGADVNAHAITRATPLHRAASDGADRVARVLLAHGAAVNDGAGEGWTPLHCAAVYRGGYDVANALLDGGANVNAPGHHGETPLYCAVGWGNIDIVELLLVRGADVTLRDSDGQTVYDEAEKRRPYLIRLLSMSAWYEATRAMTWNRFSGMDDHDKGFEKEAYFGMVSARARKDCPVLMNRTVKHIIAHFAPEFLKGLFERRPCARKLRYVGCGCAEQPCPHGNPDFVQGQVYESIDFNGGTYTVRLPDGNTSGCGSAYFEVVKDEEAEGGNAGEQGQ